MKLRFTSFIIYFAVCSFIMGWWTLAFHKALPSENSKIQNYNASSATLSIQISTLLPYLSKISRDTLHDALNGDFELAAQFIKEWDLDAQILEAKGMKGVQRLSSETLFHVQVLSRIFKESTIEKRAALNRFFRFKALQDDLGHVIPVTDSFSRFLPQTHVTASILLAIANPEEIVAIPRGMYDIPQLYPFDKMKRISRNLDGYNSEKLFLLRPDLTFISPYSHPSTVEALKRQGLELCVINKINHFQDIQETLLKVGHATNHPLEANLLSIFFEASLLCVDNRIKAIRELSDDSEILSILYLCYNQGYKVPTTKCLTGQLLLRALQHYPGLSCTVIENQDEWYIPIDKEKIINKHPDYLIISTQHERPFELLFEPIFNQPICYLDENVQGSPTHYMALAYFDIYQAIAATHLP